MSRFLRNRFVWLRYPGLIVLVVVLLVLSGCGDAEADRFPTPDVEILAPTATSLVARVEVMVVVVTPTAAPPEEQPVEQPTEPPATAPPATEPPATAPPEEQPTSQPPGQTTAPPSPTAQTDEETGEQISVPQASPMSNQQLINMGEDIYASECAACHQSDGQGTNIYPALTGSALLEQGDPTQAIQIVLHGRGQMPAFEDTLSNQQIAAVLSYARNAWQNNASVVHVAQVRRVRQGQSAMAEQPAETSAGTSAGTPAETVAATGTATATVTTSGTGTVTATAATAAATVTPTGEAAEATATPMTPTAETATASGSPSPEAAAADAQELIDMGEQIYAANCASCHQLSGQGNVTYPALAGSALLTAEDPTAAIEIVLNGREEMPAFSGLLSNQEIAAVLSHARNAWGNDASVVTVEEVEAVQQGDTAATGAAAEEETTSTAATAAATAAMTATVTGTVTGTVTSTVTVTATTTVAATGTPTETATTEETATAVPATAEEDAEEEAEEATPTPEVTVAGDAGGENPPLTWTPTFEVTPLLPATGAEDGDGTTTPTPAETTPAEETPAATVAPSPQATGAVTVTGTTTSTAAAATPTAADAATAEVTGTATEAGTATATSQAAEAGEAQAQELISMGEEIYASECASCHLPSGMGLGSYPALAESELLTSEDPTEAIRMVLYGRGEMPAFADVLSTEEIAAVLSHERTAWDNDASVVTVEQVEEVAASPTPEGETGGE